MSSDSGYNGKHTTDLYNNVTYIRARIDTLEDSMNRLAHSVDRLAQAEENRAVSDDKIITHIKESIPVKFVVLISLIICVAFIGGGLLKEIIDSHLLIKFFG